jgi:hypothetical protein
VIDIEAIAQKLAVEEGVFALSIHRGMWTVAIEWGKETEDSPMCAAAAYGVGDTAAEAITAALADACWDRTEIER